MKKSLKLIAGLCAAVMLLTSGITAISAASVFPSAPNPGFPLSSSQYNPYYGVFLPGITAPTPDQLNAYYQYYWGTMYPPYIGGVVTTPGILPAYTVDVEMNQFDVYNLGYGAGVTYYSNNPTVATVNPYGFVYGNTPGTAYILVSNEKTTFAVIKVTVNELSADAISNLQIVTRVASPRIAVGETTTLYAYVTVNGSTYPWQSFPYELEYEVVDEDVITFDESTGMITGKGLGSSEIIINIKDTTVAASVTIYVVQNPSPTVPSYPGVWYPIGSGNNGFINNGWVVVIPGYGTIGGIIPGYSYPWYSIPGLDSDEYDFEVRSVYVKGEWKLALVPVLKDTTEEKAPEEEKPATPVLTPAEMEALAKEEAEAKRLAALKDKIAQAKAGKLAWYEVYSDISGDSPYTAGVSYVLSNDLLAGNDDGTFGRAAKMTYGDLSALFSKYLKITEEALTAKKIIPTADAKDTLTREDMAVAFYNLAKELKLDVSKTRKIDTYKDYTDLDADARTAFAWAAANYLFDLTTTELDAHASVNKAQLAQAIYLLNRLVG